MVALSLSLSLQCVSTLPHSPQEDPPLTNEGLTRLHACLMCGLDVNAVIPGAGPDVSSKSVSLLEVRCWCGAGCVG